MQEIREKVYDPDKDKSYTKAKAAKCRRNAGNNGFIGADLSSGLINFPTEDSAFKEDFSVLPVFEVYELFINKSNKFILGMQENCETFLKQFLFNFL